MRLIITAVRERSSIKKTRLRGGGLGLSGISGICWLGLSASLLAGRVAKLLQPLLGPGQPANQSIEACT